MSGQHRQVDLPAVRVRGERHRGERRIEAERGVRVVRKHDPLRRRFE